MIYHRKNYNNAWSLYKLGKDDVAKVRTITATQGVLMRLEIDRVAKDKGLNLSESSKDALLNYAAATFESFASDYIESVEAAKLAKAQTETPPA